MDNKMMLEHIVAIATAAMEKPDAEWTQDESVLLAKVYVGFIALSGNGGAVMTP